MCDEGKTHEQFPAESNQLRREREALKALQEAEENFTRVFNFNPQPMAIASSRDGCYLEVNDAFTQKTGYDREEVIGRTAEELGLWANYSRAEFIEDFIKGRKAENREVAYCTKSGEVRYGMFSVESIHFKGERFFLGTLNEINERKLLEDRLKQSEQRLRELIRFAPTAIYQVDFRVPRFTAVNDVMCLYSGYSREELLSMSPFEILDEDGKNRFRERIKMSLAGEKVDESVEYRVIKKDGTISYMILQNTFIYEKGIPVGAFVIAHDVTEMKMTENALRQSEELFSKAFYCSPNPMSILQLDDGRYVDVNEAWVRACGYSREEAVGRTAADLNLNADPDVITGLRAEFRKRGSLSNREIRFRYKNGSIRHCLVSGEIINLNGEACLLANIIDITERKQAEERLLNERQRFFNLLDRLPVLISLFAPDYRIVFANRRFHEEFFIPDQGLGYKSRGYDEPGTECQTAKVFEDGLPREWELCKDGRKYHIYSYPFNDIDGSPMVIEVGVEVTEQSKMVGRLRESEDRYRTIFENNPDGILLTISDGTIIDANTAAGRLFGYTKEELCEIGRRGVIDIDDPRRAVSIRKLESTGTTHGEMTLIRKDGTRFEGEITSSRYKTQDGGYQATLIVRDITESKKAQEALRVSEERFYKAFHKSPVIMCISRLEDEVFIDVNQAWENCLGYTRQETLGKTSLDLNIWVDIKQRAKVYRQLRKSRPLPTLETEFRSRDGKIINVVCSTEVVDINGQPCVLINIVDLSENKRLERELARLDRLNLIGEMAASIGHEIRNPMTTIRGFLQMVRQKETYIQDIEYFDLMIEELDRANGIISDYLSMAKNKVVDLKPRYLNSIIRALYPMIQADGTYRDELVVLDLDEPAKILIDEKEIRQLILNLARNGLEAMEPGGTLTIGTRSAGGDSILFIKDEGKGIRPELLDKIGTPFVTTKDNGTGLGLAVCYSIAARHGARIEVETGPAGTVFSVRFKNGDKEKH